MPLASWRWTCDSVLRAPIAPQLTASEMNWGWWLQEFRGGGESFAQHADQRLAREQQALADVVAAVDVGVVDQPFQPTVVRGFSKYTRITMSSSPSVSFITFDSRCA